MQQVRYRAEEAANLLIRPLDALTLIYHRRSGMTHVVASPVPEMLRAMESDAVGAPELLARLSRDYDLSGEGEALLAAIAARLEELAALGLAERL